MSLTKKMIWFPEPHKAEIKEEPVREPGEDEILIRTSRTLVSPCHMSRKHQCSKVSAIADNVIDDAMQVSDIRWIRLRRA